MLKMYLAMERELLIISQQNGNWQVDSQLVGMQPVCVATDPLRPEQVYCGTFGRGLWRSQDAGTTWTPIGDAGIAMGPAREGGITFSQIMSVAVSATERSEGMGVVYAGTEPTALFRSEDGGETWRELKGLRQLPSAPTWSFPPRPYTSHVRWITADPLEEGSIFCAIEAGVLVHSPDGGQTWEDRLPDAPYDTHTLIAHRLAPGRLYSAAGDGFSTPGRGYSESYDKGQTWQRPDQGLEHHYLWGLAVDLADPDTILVSASASPEQAHNPHRATSTIYRRTSSDRKWQEVRVGLPEVIGTVIPVLTAHPSEPGVFYTLTNKGLYRSADAGLSWETMPIPWQEQYHQQHQQALVINEL